jgi:uncharacterized membrane protein
VTWAEVAPAIQLHLVAALLALGIGVTQLARAKGTASHVLLGRAWVAIMLVAALSSFFIRELNEGRYSWIHLLSAWTLFALAMGVWRIRAGRVHEHAGWMIGTFVGGLLVAGGFAVFGQGRVLGKLFG